MSGLPNISRVDFYKVLACSLILATPCAAQTTNYVSLSGSHIVPFSSWETAATNIQDAVDAASAGDTVLVSNGVYKTGGRLVYGATTNRVAVTKALTLRSVNGPQSTIIQGVLGANVGITYRSIRCVYLTNGAALIGFTLTNGAAGSDFVSRRPRGGAGVCCESTNATVTDCILVCNWADYYDSYGSGSGGGAYSGTLNNCILKNNKGYYGGAAFSNILNNCTLIDNSSSYYGGGAFMGTLNNCILSNNTARTGGGACYSILNNCLLTTNNANYSGGGVYRSVLNNCFLLSNKVAQMGGAAASSVLNNCTIVGNTAQTGGSTHYGTMNNCILYGNMPSFYGGTFRYCCLSPLPSSIGSVGNITNEPAFVAYENNWSLATNSPCINAGNNAYASRALDLHSNPRIMGGTVDMGAYEFQAPSTTFPVYWLQQYNLPVDGSADALDSDSDGLSNWQEWLADTCPTNVNSVFQTQIVNTSTNAFTLVFTGSTNRIYTLYYQTNLAANSSNNLPVQTNIFGIGGTQTLSITNSGFMGFYRLEVKLP